MPKSPIFLCFLLLVPMFGLTSCAPDSGANRTAVEDTWRLKQPVIEDQAGARLLVSNPSLPALSALAEISLTALEGNSAWEPEFQLEVKSECSASGTTANEVYNLIGPLKKRLWEWVPTPVLLAAGTEGVVTCQFFFTGKNSRGSIHRFSIESLRISELNTLEHITLSRRPPADLYLADSFHWAELSQLILSGLPPKAGAVQLKCTGFETRLQSENLGAINPAALVTDELQRHLEVPPATQEKSELCRLLAESDGERYLSRPFTIELNAPSLPTQNKIALDGYATPVKSLRDVALLETKISNPSAVDVVIRIDRRNPGSVDLQPTYFDGPELRHGIVGTWSFPLFWRTDPGPHILQDTAQELRLIIRPQSEITLRTMLYTHLRCGDTTADRGTLTPLPNVRFAGFRFVVSSRLPMDISTHPQAQFLVPFPTERTHNIIGIGSMMLPSSDQGAWVGWAPWRHGAAWMGEVINQTPSIYDDFSQRFMLPCLVPVVPMPPETELEPIPDY